jgi:hypothetical protein
MEDYFFQKKGYDRKRGFDSYSRDANDIIDFYFFKYPELSPKYKRSVPLERKELNAIRDGHNDVWLDTPFEQYIAAFLFAMDKNFEEAERRFCCCIDLLDDTLASSINAVFMKLQLAQLYERMANIEKALGMLLTVYREFKRNKELLAIINNFYASCCISIGLIYIGKRNKRHIAAGLFTQSIGIRLSYRSDYPPQICENYLATAYRYRAVALEENHIDRYIDFKTAYSLRSWLLGSTQDEFTKVEFAALSVDLLHFLISHTYTLKYINKVANRLYKVIFSLNNGSRTNNQKMLTQVSVMLAKFYFLKEEYFKFYKWHALTKELKRNFQLNIDEAFLNSEEIFALIKN